MSYELIIFDSDGVLVDSEPIINGVFVEMLRELGLHLDYQATLREFSGVSMETRLEKTRQLYGWSGPVGFVEQFNQRVTEIMKRQLQPVSGIREVLQQVQVPWCVASNGGYDHLRFRLGLAGLLEEFAPPLFSADEVARPKPAPDLFLHAARSMGVGPDRCAVIEDSVAGVTAAVAAGMEVFGFARLTPPNLLEEAGSRVFEQMAELPALLFGPGCR